MLKKITYLLFLISLFTTLLLNGIRSAQSYSTDAPEVLISLVKNATVPTCNSCHGNGTMGQIPVTGGISLSKTDDNLYAAGVEYPITLSVDNVRNRHGFQFIALDEQGKSIGSLSDTSTLVQVEPDAVHSVSHASHHNLPASNGNSFRFNWTAPENYQGKITFHMISVAANGDGTNSGDLVYYDTFTLRYDASVGIAGNELRHTKIYPTILQETLYVEHTGAGELILEMHNASGEKIAQTNVGAGVSSVALPKLQSGLYFVHLSNRRGQQFVQKILVR